MKNIYEILAGLNIQVPEEQREAFNKEVAENYKTIAEFQKKEDKLALAEDKARTAQEALTQFEGVNLEEMKGKISALQKELETKDFAYQNQLAEMEFNHSLEAAISAAKGKNSKAIAALLDVEALKGSKNQGEDIQKALEAIKSENAYLFQTEQGQQSYQPNKGNSPTAGGFSFNFMGVRNQPNE